MRFGPSRFRRASAVVVACLVGVLSGFVAVAPAQAILGGSEAGEPYAFLGSLQRLDSPRSDLHVCGVALIAPQWGVTAGHCARSAADSNDADRPTSGHPVGWQVRFGATRVDSGGEVVRVEQFVKRSITLVAADDIALLRFDRPVTRAPIATVGERPRVGTAVRIMGWGMQQESCGEFDDPACYPKSLRQADTEVQPQETCSFDRDPTILCIGARDGTVRPENMDSGGPAVVRDGAQWRLAGLVEGGADTGTNSAPSMYVDITRHTGWIDGYVSGRTPLPPDSPAPTPSLNGTVKIGSCSGSAIRGAQSRPGDRVLVLTNGHCVDPRPQPGEVLAPRTAAQTVLFMGDSGDPVLRTKTTDLLYATMTDTDLAVYRTELTYADLDRSGVRTFALADQVPAPGQQLRLMSGTWQRSFACTVDMTAGALNEGGYTQRNAIRYRNSDTCEPGGGTSGSPLLDVEGKIAGLHNTSAYRKQPGEDQLPPEARMPEPAACAENNPCEIGADGTGKVVEGAHYGQQLMGLNACLDKGSRLDLNRSGCLLPQHEQTAAASSADSGRTGRYLIGGVVLAATVLAGLIAVAITRRSRGADR